MDQLERLSADTAVTRRRHLKVLYRWLFEDERSTPTGLPG